MTKHEIEYEDAPSGYVTFYNYKEPLMKYEKGYGYLGAVVFDGETDKIQCSLCGEWFVQLAPHLKREHNMKVGAYKEELGLFQNTALIGENMRAKLIATGLDKRMQNLRQAHLKRKKGGFKVSESTRAKIRATLKKNAEKSEHKNLRGTCPAQLLDRMKKIYDREGENLSIHEHFGGLEYSIIKTYGSFKEACRLAGIPYRKPGTNRNYNHSIKHRDSDVLDFMKEFITRFNRMPKRKDFKAQGKQGLYIARIEKFKKLVGAKKLRKLAKEAYASLDNYKNSEDRIYYTKEELLNYLRKFEQSQGRKPSYSDAKRKLIPSLQRFHYHFGSWQNALKLAFN